MRKIKMPIFILLLLCFLAAASACTAEDTNDTAQREFLETSSEQPDLTDPVHIQINVRDYGTIDADLYPNVAPATVDNFIRLAESGFYDGLTFHRVIKTFMIQGGDPLGNGTGGSGEAIVGEFMNNGHVNLLSHTRGVLSMARGAASYDSASSQFFIVHEDAAFLNGDYAAFGMVTDGIEIVDAIAAETPVEDDNGTVLPENQPVIDSIVVVD